MSNMCVTLNEQNLGVNAKGCEISFYIQ